MDVHPRPVVDHEQANSEASPQDEANQDVRGLRVEAVVYKVGDCRVEAVIEAYSAQDACIRPHVDAPHRLDGDRLGVRHGSLSRLGRPCWGGKTSVSRGWAILRGAWATG